MLPFHERHGKARWMNLQITNLLPRHLVAVALRVACVRAADDRVGGGLSEDALSREALTARITEGIRVLNKTYWSPTLNIWLDRPGDDLRAHYERRLNPPWWPSANAVEMLIDFMNATGSSEYDATIEALYDLQKDLGTRTERVVAELKRRGQWSEADESAWQRRQERKRVPKKGTAATEYYSDFQNEYLDDSGWWGITWLKMYERTKQRKYLTTAQTIHAHMAKNWNPEKGGGVMWSEDADKQRPNAITNTLFLVLSARLYQDTQENAFLEWAERTIAWLDEKNLYDGTAVVDAPGHMGDYWSYNQGTYIGGLTAMFEATGESRYLQHAVDATETVLRRSGLVTADGVLIEKLGIKGDASLFKGVLARYLAHLRDVLESRDLGPAMVTEIDRVLRASAASLLRHKGVDGLYTADWLETVDGTTGFNTQTSALAGLVAVLRSQRTR
jgi:predicted alpha-1,6-mannanase (GH76 family)